MLSRMALIVMIAAAIAGCRTGGNGMRTIPIARDYGELGEVDFEEVREILETAHRAGAQHYAPHEYYSACHYIELARQLKRPKLPTDRGAGGFEDYALLAKSMAEASLRKCTGTGDRAPMPMPKDKKACQAEFDRIKARYEELDRDKAIEASPIIYAQLSAALSLAEYGLLTGDWKRAAEALVKAEPDIDIILVQDVDEDGVPDMEDGAPNKPEDIDRFEDGDGVPDPDNDADGVPDAVDEMPDEPETPNGWHDADGAPDQCPKLEAIVFDGEAMALPAEAKGYLRGINELLAEWPKLKLRVEGRAGGARSETDDLDVARECAEKVQAYLVEHGADKARLLVTFESGADIANAEAALVLE